MNKLPAWARKLLVVASIIAPMSAASVTGFKACYEIRAAKSAAQKAEVKATETKTLSDSGYDTLSPAIAEIQQILNSAQEWAAETDGDLDEYADRLQRCEDYMDKLSHRRGFPKLPDLDHSHEEGPWYESPVASMVIPGLPSSSGPKKTVKTVRPIPVSLSKAADYQQQRVEMECPPSDPLCGAAGLE